MSHFLGGINPFQYSKRSNYFSWAYGALLTQKVAHFFGPTNLSNTYIYCWHKKQHTTSSWSLNNMGLSKRVCPFECEQGVQAWTQNIKSIIKQTLKHLQLHKHLEAALSHTSTHTKNGTLFWWYLAISVKHILRSHYEWHTILGELLQYIAHT